ncbi:hypothetical protein SLNSH_06275 [Alsobacter soli]|uniref:Uncharacterized protein n=1 Tax=Alsobacter soli TaxID=2109933 RepID=A0A2T1HWM5_9HYPH|nr:hypothetical protein SLNSH_06275 [Alsobacter soli]
MRALFGTNSDDFAQAQLDALFKTLSTGLGRPPTEAEMNSAIALVAGVEPQNEVEGALATQMAVVHAVSLRLAGRLMSTDPLHADFASAGNIAAKFFRAFGRQVEALVRLRRPTAQLIRVERLNINEGANAIVGTVTTRKGVAS